MFEPNRGFCEVITALTTRIERNSEFVHLTFCILDSGKPRVPTEISNTNPLTADPIEDEHILSSIGACDSIINLATALRTAILNEHMSSSRPYTGRPKSRRTLDIRA